MPRRQAILSLHDVMPETLEAVQSLLGYLRTKKVPPATLLVVPGRHWEPRQLDFLHRCVEEGHELAAHGWLHEISGYGSSYHRLHSLLLSRQVAEHLSLDPQAIEDLMRRSHAWFAHQGLPSPRLYVPPAWALGKVSAQALANLPYAHVEVLQGFIEVKSQKRIRTAMVGFEADIPWRAMAVRLWNLGQLAQQRILRQPLRIGLHPFDRRLLLANDLDRLLSRTYEFIVVRQLSS